MEIERKRFSYSLTMVKLSKNTICKKEEYMR